MGNTPANYRPAPYWPKPKNPLPFAKPIGKIPVVGPWYSRLGRIHNYMIAPCAINPYAVFMATVVAAPRLVYGLFGPDCTDDAWDWLKGKGKGHKRGAIFKTLGKRGPAFPVNPGLSHFIIPLGDLAQRVGWYITLVDQTSEFLVNWTSLMYQYQGCKGTDTPYAQAHLEAGFGLIPFGGEHIVGSWTKDGAHIFNVGFSELVVPSGFKPGVGFSLSSGPSPLGPPDGTWSARLWRQGGPDVEEWQTPELKPDGTQSVTWYNFSAYGDDSGGVYRVKVRTQGGPVWLTGGSFNAYGSHPRDQKIGINPSRCDPVGQAFKHLDA